MQSPAAEISVKLVLALKMDIRHYHISDHLLIAQYHKHISLFM
jgi:hypothetical protein